jgi:hypothetical protein
MATLVVVLFLLGNLALCLWLADVCWRRGKRKTAVLGFFFFHPALVVGAIRLAKPDSPAGMSYSDEKFERSCKRFPKQAAYGRNARPIYAS